MVMHRVVSPVLHWYPRFPSGPHSCAVSPWQIEVAPEIEQTGFGTTVTLNVQRATLPHASVAVQVTVVSPTGNVVPGGGTQTTGTGPEHASVAVAV